MILTGENQSTWRRNCSSVTLSTENPTHTGLGLKMGLCSEGPVTNHLSHAVKLDLLQDANEFLKLLTRLRTVILVRAMSPPQSKNSPPTASDQFQT